MWLGIIENSNLELWTLELKSSPKNHEMQGG